MMTYDHRRPRARCTRSVLRQDLPSPLAPESDEEKPEKDKDKAKDKDSSAEKPGADGRTARSRRTGEAKKPDTAVVVKLDLDALTSARSRCRYRRRLRRARRGQTGVMLLAKRPRVFPVDGRGTTSSW